MVASGGQGWGGGRGKGLQGRDFGQLKPLTPSLQSLNSHFYYQLQLCVSRSFTLSKCIVMLFAGQKFGVQDQKKKKKKKRKKEKKRK